MIARRAGIGIRSALMMSIYEQSLKLTSSARQQNSVGQTVNLMSIDTEKLFLSTQFIHFLWHGPVVAILVMFLIIPEVGWQSAMAGLAWTLCIFPLQTIFARAIGGVRRKMIKLTDERVKFMNELLQAIRVIKFYAWEKPLENRVMKVMSAICQ
jgi:ABC-type multidrug transport system fused ATPase/permease subunit